MLVLRQLVFLLAMLAGLVAIPVAVISIGIGVHLSSQDPNATPMCDERPMTPNSICYTYRNGRQAGGTSYDQAVRAQRNSHESGKGALGVGALAVLVGLVALAVYRNGPPDPAPAPAAPGVAPAKSAVPQPQNVEDRLRRAAEGGNSVAMNDLARLLRGRGARRSGPLFWLRSIRSQNELDEAELWLRRAAVAGHPEAMGSLAAVLQRGDQLDEAEIWFRRAIQAGETSRMRSLAELLDKRGNSAEAQERYRKAAQNPEKPRPTTVNAHARMVSKPASSSAGDYAVLLTMVMGSRATAERLIAFEQQKSGLVDRASLITRAIDRLREDRRRG
ncbi:tetratricopeptide repeat protein [Nocardia brasiliensis]|uniref:tetratricopeptide repeat protein n=1 Tax=Nocardia brasiliensis TaxID=37326 RepID=UPI002454AE97|nr:tetratricopeptide repeat protein [Nocardia brasiliensis]